MTLEEALSKLDTLDEEDTLYVREPWTPSSECVIAPADSKPMGFRYFLEAATIREVLEVLDGDAREEGDEIRLLLFYAENDAYPRWVYR